MALSEDLVKKSSSSQSEIQGSLKSQDKKPPEDSPKVYPKESVYRVRDDEKTDEKEDLTNKLPNAKDAVFDDNKLTAYALNPEHLTGKHKAKVFKSALGYDLSNADQLKTQILFKLPNYNANLGEKNKFGQLYSVDIPITGPNGNTVTVKTAWIIKQGDTVPNLVTLYIPTK